MTDFLMPKLGADMSAGTLVAWHKKPGDAVRRGDVIATVETEKGAIDVEVFTNGTMAELLIPIGETVPVGTVLARILEVQATESSEVIPAASSPVPSMAPTGMPPLKTVPPSSRQRVSPSARTLAEHLGVDLSVVHGTGPNESITRDDVQRAASNQKSQPAPIDRQASLRKTIAAAMSRSKREIPHYYLSTTIDMGPALTWLAEQNQQRSVADRLLPGALLIKATALALRQVPELNAAWLNEQVVLSQSVHVGVAVALRKGGLIAPAIHDTDRLSLTELMQALRDLVNRARAGSLRSSEMADPTITITSLGDQGVETVYGVIYPPQVALVGFGKIVDRPWVVHGEVQARPVVSATLAADHRVSDGHRGGRFLATVDRFLQEPAKL